MPEMEECFPWNLQSFYLYTGTILLSVVEIFFHSPGKRLAFFFHFGEETSTHSAIASGKPIKDMCFGQKQVEQALGTGVEDALLMKRWFGK